MSDSPQPNPKDVEQDAQSPNEDDQINESQDPHLSALGYEFDVKEQDRWLPIANGKFFVFGVPSCSPSSPFTYLIDRLLISLPRTKHCKGLALQ